MKNAVPFIGGVVMAIGLAISGMTQPENVIGFLDFTGSWNPALLATMFAAMLVYALAWRLRGRGALFQPAAPIDRRLLIGSLIFGAGWGLVGICPGPGLVALPGGDRHFLFFIAGMLGGMALLAATQDPVSDSCG
jgi:uncharacterized membrane protein YedE/YeeE